MQPKYEASWRRHTEYSHRSSSEVVLLHTCLQLLPSSHEQSCPVTSVVGGLECSHSALLGPWIWWGQGCTHSPHCFAEHRPGPGRPEEMEWKKKSDTLCLDTSTTAQTDSITFMQMHVCWEIQEALKTQIKLLFSVCIKAFIQFPLDMSCLYAYQC